jgi:hypothetical protein
MASAQRSDVSSQDACMAVVAKTDDARSIVNILTAIHLKKEIVRGRGRARACARVHAPARASAARNRARFFIRRIQAFLPCVPDAGASVVSSVRRRPTV